MNKVFKCLFFICLSSFIFITNVNAECTYQERKQLLNEAKNASISFDVFDEEKEFIGINPNTEQEEKYIETVYIFRMNISGITNNMFAKITNDFDSNEIIVNYSDMKDEIYSFNIENTTDIINYYVDFYSTNSNCYAEKIITKSVKKPKENPVYYYSVCSNEKVEDSNYCKQFIDKDFSVSDYEIVNELNGIIGEDKIELQNNDNLLNKTFSFVKSYWYIFLILVVVIIVVITFIFVRRKRSRL